MLAVEGWARASVLELFLPPTHPSENSFRVPPPFLKWVFVEPDWTSREGAHFYGGVAGRLYFKAPRHEINLTICPLEKMKNNQRRDVTATSVVSGGDGVSKMDKVCVQGCVDIGSSHGWC